jgi:hypothetical protein
MRRSPGLGVTLDIVTRLKQTLDPRPRQAPDGRKSGGNQPTDRSRFNRRIDWLRPSGGLNDNLP